MREIAHVKGDGPLITLPTPIAVLKSPRPLELSNLEVDTSQRRMKHCCLAVLTLCLGFEPR